MEILRKLGAADRAGVALIFTPSAHPSPWLACSKIGLETFLFTRRLSIHPQRHWEYLGRALLKDGIEKQLQQSLVGGLPGVVSVSATTQNVPATSPKLYQSIQARINGKQVVEAYDIAPGTSWMDGMNRNIPPNHLSKEAHAWSLRNWRCRASLR